jgi:hypothetical protein
MARALCEVQPENYSSGIRLWQDIGGDVQEIIKKQGFITQDEVWLALNSEILCL